MYQLERFLGDRFNRINILLEQEYGMMHNNINMIGSANYPFPSVVKALGTPIYMNPAEGHPGRRYFPGCANLDDIEIYGEKLARQYFNLSTNYDISLQPHSGTQANQIVYNACLKQGDKILSFRTDCGGHVSHSFFNKKYFNLVEYGIDENERVDYKQMSELAEQHEPKLIIAGASSYPREFDYALIKKIASDVDALLLADVAHTVLYTANDIHKTPFGYADFITFTTHKTLRGPRGGIIIYRKEWRKKIQTSIFPLSQGAPIFNEVLAKVVMFIELTSRDTKKYSESILKLAKHFSKCLQDQGLKLYTDGTDMHLVVVDLRGSSLTGVECERELESINILVNRNLVPHDPLPANVTSGLRFGLLSLATLDFTNPEIERLAALITRKIVFREEVKKEEVISLIKPHFNSNLE